MTRARHWSYQGEKNRLIVLRAAGYRCQIAGPDCEGRARTVDHIIPKAHGGADILENLRAACWVCNGRKGVRAAGAPMKPIFKDHSRSRAPLQNTPPRSRWESLRDADWRKGSKKGR